MSIGALFLSHSRLVWADYLDVQNPPACVDLYCYCPDNNETVFVYEGEATPPLTPGQSMAIAAWLYHGEPGSAATLHSTGSQYLRDMCVSMNASQTRDPNSPAYQKDVCAFAIYKDYQPNLMHPDALELYRDAESGKYFCGGYDATEAARCQDLFIAQQDIIFWEIDACVADMEPKDMKQESAAYESCFAARQWRFDEILRALETCYAEHARLLEVYPPAQILGATINWFGLLTSEIAECYTVDWPGRRPTENEKALNEGMFPNITVDENLLQYTCWSVGNELGKEEDKSNECHSYASGDSRAGKRMMDLSGDDYIAAQSISAAGWSRYWLEHHGYVKGGFRSDPASDSTAPVADGSIPFTDQIESSHDAFGAYRDFERAALRGMSHPIEFPAGTDAGKMIRGFEENLICQGKVPGYEAVKYYTKQIDLSLFQGLADPNPPPQIANVVTHTTRLHEPTAFGGIWVSKEAQSKVIFHKAKGLEGGGTAYGTESQDCMYKAKD